MNVFPLGCLRFVHRDVRISNDVLTAEAEWISDGDPNAQADSVG
jgi:hypothetical protein